jgi:hypothetical protein
MNTLPFIGSLTVTGSSEITSSNALYNGSTILTTNLTGSLLSPSTFNNFTSSYNTGSFVGSFTGSLNGTASIARTASFIATSSYVSQNLGYIMEATDIQNGIFSGSSGINVKWVSPITGINLAQANSRAPGVGVYWEKATLERIIVILDAPLPSTPGYNNIILTTFEGTTEKENFIIPTGSNAGPIVFNPNPLFYFPSLSVATLYYSLTNTGTIDIPASPNILGKIITYIRLT